MHTNPKIIHPIIYYEVHTCLAIIALEMGTAYISESHLMKPCDVILDSQGLGGSNNLGWSSKDGLFFGGGRKTLARFWGMFVGYPENIYAYKCYLLIFVGEPVSGKNADDSIFVSYQRKASMTFNIIQTHNPRPCER